MLYHRRIPGNNERGQILLVVVLVMVVAATVGLSLASRSVVNTKTTVDEQDSQKAFSAAEAGVEQALQTQSGNTTKQPLGNNAFITNVSIGQLGGTNSFLMNNGQVVHQDDGGDVWLAAYNADPSQITPVNMTIQVYWGDSSSYSCTSSTNKAALEVMVLTEPGGAGTTPQIAHYAYDGCSRSNNFTAPDPTVNNYNFGTVTLKQGVSLAISNGLYARVVPLYSDAIIGVRATGGSFPSQGKIITSTGAAGVTQRKVSYFQSYASVPTEFFYTLFSTQ